MDWITLIWGGIATVYLTLAAIHLMIFLDHRTEKWQLVFALCAVSAATLAMVELLVITTVQTADEYRIVTKVGQVAFSTMIVTAAWFASYFLRAGRRWLKLSLTVSRVLIVFMNVVAPDLFGLGIIVSFQREPLFNGSLPAVKYAYSPWQFFGTITIIGLMMFVLDATVTAWRRGDRKMAVRVGGSSIVFYLVVIALALYVAGFTGAPIVSVLRYPLYSVFFMAVILAMSFELSRAVFRAVTIARELRENETRVSLAADSAGVGLWSRNMKSGKVWANDQWFKMFGFSPAIDPADADASDRIHESDRPRVTSAFNAAVENGDHYDLLYRVKVADAGVRWYASRGRVETDPSDQSVVVRSATIDVTERKLAEEAAIDLSGRLISAQEDERARLARELHDGLNQSLALISIELGLLGKKPPSETGVAEKQIAEYAGRVRDLSTDLRRLSLDLHPSRLEQLGLASSLEGLCNETDRAQSMTVELTCGDIPLDLPNDRALCIYRIVQECLQNALKHSAATTVSVKAEVRNGQVMVSVSDNGKGFDASSSAYTQSLGLVSMRERVRMLKGTFSIDSKPGSGTRISATIPVSA